MKILLTNVCMILLFGWLTVASTRHLQMPEFASAEDPTQSDEVLYLPNVKAIEFASFGYRNFLANVIWFKTINYFGKHYRADQDYRWLFTLCDLITTLNPRAEHVYEFGAMMLAWEQHVPEKAVELLDKALIANKETWSLFYYRGVFKLFFLQDDEGALSDFKSAAKLPDAHQTAINLAQKELSELEGEKHGARFLRNMLEAITDEDIKAVIREKIKKLETE